MKVINTHHNTQSKSATAHGKTIPSLQGTLAKRSKPTLQANFSKEPFRPSRSNTGQKDGANLIDKRIENNNRQCLTFCK